ncbi:uncharacterized protein LOC132754339 [Ruditapes philippinarum]|uniref:uncharacterized protein LOC132754339 n=1 Tax=Ruditapes philippinarum TaxID=129788 RepID=UPI00295B58B5|nr:uncharacterized protein LOC132754339 [Ruditapes philippinarum]
MGRGMTIDYPKPLHQERRAAPPPATSWKKQRTEDTLLKVRKATEEKRSTGKRRPNKRMNVKCWVPNCLEPAQYIKVHAFKHHVPGIFDERLQPDDEWVLRGRRNALIQAARWLLVKPAASLDELMSFVRIQKLLLSTGDTVVSSTQMEAMQAFCGFLKSPIPKEFILEPINSPGALIHWKVLLLVAASLNAEEREYWKTSFPIPEGMVIDEPEEEPAEILPEAYDSHFHLDRTLRELNLPSSGTLEDILAKVPVDHDKRIKLVG